MTAFALAYRSLFISLFILQDMIFESFIFYTLLRSLPNVK